ncbi:MAG: aldolase [Terracidiphilus sp.]|jgi:hypothetical protein
MISALENLPVQTMEMLTVEQLKHAWSRSEPIRFCDPYLSSVEYNQKETFYPLGFPVNLSTNSMQVLDAAAECWSRFTKVFDVEPITLNIGVTAGTSRDCPALPTPRMRECLSSNIADAENFVISDYRKAISNMWVTSATLEHRDYFRYFFLNSTVMGQLVHRYAWGIHAACVELDGSGLLFCGDSGAGKSTLSYACARAGWTYITDDGSYLVDGRDDRLIVGDCSLVRFRPSSESLFPELSGRPVMQRAEIGKPSIEFATSSVPRFNTSSMSRIKHVLFLNRNVDRQELVPFPVEVAKLYMLQRASAEPQLRNRQARMFDRLLEGGVFEIRYTDLDWAVERLRLLVREGC